MERGGRGGSPRTGTRRGRFLGGPVRRFPAERHCGKAGIARVLVPLLALIALASPVSLSPFPSSSAGDPGRGAWPGWPATIAASPKPEKTPVRTVAVKAVADSRLRVNEIWKVDISCHLREVNRHLRGDIGVIFRITSFEYWDADPRGGSPLSLLPGLRARVSGPARGDAEIVIGVVPEGPEGPVDPGISDYLNGIVIVKYLKKKGGICYVLLHELCHLFGAVDLRESGSVMSLERPAFRIDGFTRAIMRANRERCFLPEKLPLSLDRLDEAISLYSERQTLGLGEAELGICLYYLKAMRARMAILSRLR